MLTKRKLKLTAGGAVAALALTILPAALPDTDVPVVDQVQEVAAPAPEPAAAQFVGGVYQLWAGVCHVSVWWNLNATLSAQNMSPNGYCKQINLYVVVAGRTVQAILKSNPGPNTIITTSIPLQPTGGCYVRTHIKSSAVGHAWDAAIFGRPVQKW